MNEERRFEVPPRGPSAASCVRCRRCPIAIAEDAQKRDTTSKATRNLMNVADMANVTAINFGMTQ